MLVKYLLAIDTSPGGTTQALSCRSPLQFVGADQPRRSRGSYVQQAQNLLGLAEDIRP
jgi:hypothetical protein